MANDDSGETNPHSSNSSSFGNSQQPSADPPDQLLRKLLESLKQEVVDETQPQQRVHHHGIKAQSPPDTAQYHHSLDGERMDHQGGVMD